MVELYWGSFPGVRQAEFEADHSLPSSAAVKNGGAVLGLLVRQQGVKLTIHFHLVPRARMVVLYLHSTIRLHGMVFNYLRTGTTLPGDHSSRLSKA
jgi:hypothetical protein